MINRNQSTLSLIEKIFFQHIAISNLSFSKYLLEIMNYTFITSREYTTCGIYLNLDMINNKINNKIQMPKFLFGEYIEINNKIDADFILYIDDLGMVKMMEIVSVQFQFDEIQIANFLFDRNYPFLFNK